MPTTYFKSSYPSFNAGSKVGPFVLRGTNPANPSGAIYLGVIQTLECVKITTSSTYNYEKLLSDNNFSIYHFLVSGSDTCQLLTQGIKAIGDIRINTLPVDGDTIVVNSGSVGKTYRFKNTLAAVNDVKIQASISATVTSLRKAIMLNGVAGTDYFNGTSIHPFFTAAEYGEVLVLTDKVGCLRVNGYTLTASNGTRFSTRTPSGGVDGTLLAEKNGTTTTQFKDVKSLSYNRYNTSDFAEQLQNYSLFPFFDAESESIEINQAHAMLFNYAEQPPFSLYGDYVIYGSIDNISWTAIYEVYDDYLNFDVFPTYEIEAYKYLKINVLLMTPPDYVGPMYPVFASLGVTTI